MQPSSSGEFERTAVNWRHQGCSSPVTAVGREEDNGSTEDLVATTGTAELSAVWTGLSPHPWQATEVGLGVLPSPADLMR